MARQGYGYTDKELLGRLQQGDYIAFAELYNRYAGTLISKLIRLVHINEVAEELHQDVFMKVWEQRESLPIDIPIQAILFRKAKSLAYNFYRKAALDKNLHERLIASSTELYDELEEHLNFKETNELIMAAIAKLPEQRQKVFTRIKLDGKSYEEVAAEFDVSLSTIKDHMTKALKFLRTELSAHNPSALFLILASSLLD